MIDWEKIVATYIIGKKSISRMCKSSYKLVKRHQPNRNSVGKWAGVIKKKDLKKKKAINF